jgi:hypothetical protein
MQPMRLYHTVIFSPSAAPAANVTTAVTRTRERVPGQGGNFSPHHDASTCHGTMAWSEEAGHASLEQLRRDHLEATRTRRDGGMGRALLACKVGFGPATVSIRPRTDPAAGAWVRVTCSTEVCAVSLSSLRLTTITGLVPVTRTRDFVSHCWLGREPLAREFYITCNEVRVISHWTR